MRGRGWLLLCKAVAALGTAGCTPALHAAADILRVENLWQFRCLVKLQVDNNIIEKISGLESLVHLEWLGVSWEGSHTCVSQERNALFSFCLVFADLSFNNIEIIEGLSSLRKLRDLSLAHNRICKLDGLDGLHRLQVLSLGHNCLEDLEQVSPCPMGQH